jgi:hypothetical protein
MSKLHEKPPTIKKFSTSKHEISTLFVVLFYPPRSGIKMQLTECGSGFESSTPVKNALFLKINPGIRTPICRYQDVTKKKISQIQ